MKQFSIELKYVVTITVNGNDVNEALEQAQEYVDANPGPCEPTMTVKSSLEE